MCQPVPASRLRTALVLAVSALILDVVSLVLPLHWRGSDDPFGTALASSVDTRQLVGFIVSNFFLPVAIIVGVWMMHRGRPAVAAGLFIGLGMLSVVTGVVSPLYAPVVAQPFILMAIRLLVAVLLFATAWCLTPARSGKDEMPPPPPPPPPPPRGN